MIVLKVYQLMFPRNGVVFFFFFKSQDLFETFYFSRKRPTQMDNALFIIEECASFPRSEFHMINRDKCLAVPAVVSLREDFPLPLVCEIFFSTSMLLKL